MAQENLIDIGSLKVPSEVVEVAVFGKQVENFLESEIGKYLVRSSESEVDKALESLKVISPLKIFEGYRLRHRIEFFELVQQRLADAIIDGRQAMKIIQGDEDE